MAEGGFLDIDFNIVGPSGQSVESGQRVSNGKYAFKADQDGVYTYCFSNKMSTMTPKIVMFNTDVGEQQTLDQGHPDSNFIICLYLLLLFPLFTQDFKSLRWQPYQIRGDDQRTVWCPENCET